MKHRTKVGLLGLVMAGAGVTGGVTALGNYLYNQVMVPKPRDPQLLEDNPILSQGRLWARAGTGFCPVTIRSVDGLLLWAALIPATGTSHRWAICLHGYHDTHESMGAIARHYHDQGWNVLLPDQRGYGNSQGSYVGWGYDERLDLVGWINRITRRDPTADIVLHGVSMGAATVLMATGGVLPRQVRAAVSDCAYTSIEEEMRHVLHSSARQQFSRPLPAPGGLLFSTLRKTVLRRAGYDLKHAAPIRAVPLSKTPTLFIHGSGDDFVPAPMMDRLYQAARCPKRLLWVPNAGHALSVGVNPELYWDTVDAFLQEYCPQGS